MASSSENSKRLVSTDASLKKHEFSVV